MLELIGVDRLTQWDVGRQINVDKDIDMVHFSNRPYGYSKNVKVTDGVADVPDMFLTSCAPLRVWAYVGNFENGYTKIEKIYEVKPKNRPEDYIYTPEEVKTWEKLQSEIGNLSDLATEAKENLVAAINEVEADMSEGVALDTTLTQSGQAADAKAVGDALAGKQPKGNYLTQDDLQAATNEVLAQAKASGEFDGADGKSAYQYAQDGGYTGTETEFAEKLAKEIPEALPNPNALTLTGAVNATYDGSTAVSVEIPSGGSSGTDISLGLTSAAVGQIIKVKAVDESGKPTAWEAADMAGGESSFPKFEKLLTHTITEEEIATNPAAFMWNTTQIPNLNDFNVFTLTIRNPDNTTKITFTKWVRLKINNVLIGGICGTSQGARYSYSISANRLYGVWVSENLYNPNNSTGTVLAPPYSNTTFDTTLADSEAVTSIGFTSYGGDYGLTAGIIVEIWGAK